jgi:hypothetical protein
MFFRPYMGSEFQNAAGSINISFLTELKPQALTTIEVAQRNVERYR